MKPRILQVTGARPQFVKVAVLQRALERRGESAPFTSTLVHTGQHYDAMLSDELFRELGIPRADYNLGVGSGDPAAQLAKMLSALAPILRDEKPSALLVYGDTLSTLAGALAAQLAYVPVIHVEAGERLFRRHNVPEEGNRILTDHSAHLCLACTVKAERFLRAEGMPPQRVRLVGDPMYDLFQWGRTQLSAVAPAGPERHGLAAGEYHLATIHRAENTTGPDVLVGLLEALDKAALPVLLPVHPRTRSVLNACGWQPSGALRLIEPVGYFEMMNLLLQCRKCITDSGGVMREAFFAGKPGIIPMENSWWSEIVEAGWAIDAGHDPQRILDAVDNYVPGNELPPGLFGDGDAGGKIIDAVADFIDNMAAEGPWHPHGHIADIPPAASSEMTYVNYGAFIERLQARGYEFAAFPAAQRLLDAGKPFILLRHDIDMSLRKALHLARIEAAHGVQSTYFVMLRTSHYNVFAAQSSEIVREILGLGHHLGLHFDCASYPATHGVADLAAACRSECAQLEQWFGRTIEFVSYHRPSALVLTGDPALSAPLEHTYMPHYTRDIHYFADSQGTWRFGHPLESEHFAAGRPLHVLVHPVWWNETPAAPYNTLSRYIQDSAAQLELSVARNCKVYRAGTLAGVTGENGD